MKREKMDMLTERSMVQVEAIEDVLISRGTDNYQKLQKVMDKADALKESLGDLEGPLFSGDDRGSTARK